MNCTIISSKAELQLECKNENEQPYHGIKLELYQIIMQLYQKGYDTFYVNGEYGIPLWTAEIICRLKSSYDITLNIAIPYEEQSTNWVEEFRDRYYQIQLLADSVTLVNTQYASECYQEADEYMIQNSDLLYVFGTKQDCLDTVDMAKELGIKVLYV